MTKPSIIALVKDRLAKGVLEQLPYESFTVSSHRQLAQNRTGLAPRLAIIEAAAEPKRLAESLNVLRNTWPMADILVWAPKATSGVVRTAFHGGAKDVVLSTVAARLAERVQQILEDQQFLPLADELAKKRARGSRFESMMSRSGAMWDLFSLCGRVAPSEATVLIAGETGTGKELLARAIHRRSGRRGRFVATNCASISPELIESELFGHEKGAFTGANHRKNGLVRHADEGTLFLDEIGDMPESAQMSLLRLLQEGKIRPVGGHDEVSVNVRVVAATHVALDEAVARGDFREDLFYRLDVIRMNIPTLRERPEDIVFLFGHFTKQLSKHYGLPRADVSDDFLTAMTNWDWSGNVRQLENFAERVILASPQRRLDARDFTRLIQQPGSHPAPAPTENAAKAPPTAASAVDINQSLEDYLAPTVERLERDYLDAILRAHHGRIAESAQQAGISRRTLLRKMNRYQFDKADYKD